MDLFILNCCLFCIGTIGVGRTVEVANALRIFKDAADRGYKIKQNTVVKINIDGENEDVQLRKLARWVPMINLLYAYNDIITYNDNMDTIFNALDSMDLIEEMSDLEKEIYNNKPTVLNAILTPIKAARVLNQIEIDKELAEKLLKEIPDTEENKDIIKLLNEIIEEEKTNTNSEDENTDKKDPPKRLFKRKK